MNYAETRIRLDKEGSKGERNSDQASSYITVQSGGSDLIVVDI